MRDMTTIAPSPTVPQKICGPTIRSVSSYDAYARIAEDE